MLLRIGTRSSGLAIAQTNLFIKELKLHYPSIETSVVKIQTTGDRLYNSPLTEIGGKALFLKEIEEALLNNAIDVAVHSLKDVPANILPGLTIPCVLEREDVRDAFLSFKYNSLAEMPPGSKLGTCSSRRKFLVNHFNPKVEAIDLRGNVSTRIAKLKAGEVDSIILAVSGLNRLGLEKYIKDIFDPIIFIPAVAQGAIGIECRQDDNHIVKLLYKLSHRETELAVNVERAFLKAIEGDCRTPIGIYTKADHDQISIIAFSAIAGKYKEFKKTGELKNGHILGRLAGEALRI
jgi:hydroxymethylbilane synthase